MSVGVLVYAYVCGSQRLISATLVVDFKVQFATIQNHPGKEFQLGDYSEQIVCGNAQVPLLLMDVGRLSPL